MTILLLLTSDYKKGQRINFQIKLEGNIKAHTHAISLNRYFVNFQTKFQKNISAT